MRNASPLANNVWAFIFRLSLSIIVVVTIIGVLYIFVPEYRRMSALQEKKEALRAKNAALETRLHDYQNRQNLFHTEPRFVERLVRDQFGMARENETIYKVIHDTPQAGPAAPANR
ncbi:MAG: septum formation initiator family protein [Kiritimatiellia bacterium]